MTGKAVILCVGDTPSALEGLEMLLEENGYRVLTATNLKETVQTFVSNSVDLALLDYHMPNMDVGVAAMHIRASKPDVPIALLSGDECLPRSALEAVDCFMPKSEPITSFLERVDYLLSLRLLFQPLDVLLAHNSGGRHTHK